MTTNKGAVVSRRDALCAGLSVCIGAAYPRLSHAADPTGAKPLITKTIPSSGERIPAIGLGTDSFRTSESDAIRDEIKRMNELGGSVIDTAAAYGDSEAIIGDALGVLGIRARMFLATKLTSGFLGGEGGGASSFQRSLERLKTQRIDLLQVHNLNGVDSLMPLLQQWKEADRSATSASPRQRVSPARRYRRSDAQVPA